MNYAGLNESIIADVMATIALINNPEIDPDVRQLNHEILLREVGTAVYDKIYEMNAFDMEISHTTGPGIDNRYYGLAKVASAAISAGALGLEEYVRNYLDIMASKAQNDATKNALQSGKHPTSFVVSSVRRVSGVNRLQGRTTTRQPKYLSVMVGVTAK